MKKTGMLMLIVLLLVCLSGLLYGCWAVYQDLARMSERKEQTQAQQEQREHQAKKERRAKKKQKKKRIPERDTKAPV